MQMAPLHTVYYHKIFVSDPSLLQFYTEFVHQEFSRHFRNYDNIAASRAK
jgi:hypothetical protein